MSRLRTAAELASERAHAADPTVRLTRKQFDALPEYSTTFPTGVFIGKRWKRNDGPCDRRHQPTKEDAVWLLCEYVPHPTDPDLAQVRWSHIIIVDETALPEGPAPCD